jgi:hypothetical protein
LISAPSTLLYSFHSGNQAARRRARVGPKQRCNQWDDDYQVIALQFHRNLRTRHISAKRFCVQFRCNLRVIGGCNGLAYQRGGHFSLSGTRSSSLHVVCCLQWNRKFGTLQ